jgi:hypothetical protein
LACGLRTLDDPIDLTPGVDLVAYRVIETALLTAADHHLSRARVTIGFTPHRLELDIPTPTTGGGRSSALTARLPVGQPDHRPIPRDNQQVEYTVTRGPKGPRAEQVRPI